MNRYLLLGLTFIFISSIYLIHSKQAFKSNLNLFPNYEIEEEKCALCIINPSDSSTASGLVLFKQKGAQFPVEVTGKFEGLIQGSHGFHIHVWGDLSDDCSTIVAGSHYNPTNMTHGGPDDVIRHVGDLGNVDADNEGNALYYRTDDVISLYGKYSIVGRSCFLHRDEDDFGRGNFADSKINGHSGPIIACGVIGLCDPNKTI